MQSITILGATGSIGVSTLDVLARHPDKYRVYALSAHSRVDELAAQCRAFMPARAVVGTAEGAARGAVATGAQADGAAGLGFICVGEDLDHATDRLGAV